MRVRFYGHIGRLSGYGRAAADLCMSLLATGRIDLEISPIDTGHIAPQEAALALERYLPLRACLRHDHELQRPDVVILHTLPLDMPRMQTLAMQAHATTLASDIPWIAYTTWEGAGLAPIDVRTALYNFEQIWSPSAASAQSFGGNPEGDLARVIPHAFDPSELDERRNPEPEDRLRAARPFRFYYSGAWNSRKNVAGLLRAWAMAFNAGDDVALAIHSSNATREQFAVALHQTGLTVPDLAPVRLIHDRTSYAEYLALHRLADCFVTATRGEAWNLPAFDAMLAGRRVIHPHYMGSDDYLSETDADCYGGMAVPATVDVQITERTEQGLKMAVVGAQGLSSRSAWMEPDLCALATLMRRAYEERLSFMDVNYDPATYYSYVAVGNKALSALEEL